MIQIFYDNGQGIVNTQLQLDEIAGVLKDPDGLLWLDMEDVPIEIAESILSSTFDFHYLAIDDALRESHTPKLDDWQGYLYIVLRAVRYSGNETEELSTPELDLFLGPNYVVTYSQEPTEALERVRSVIKKDQRWMNRGAGHLLYRLVDELVSDAVAGVEKMQDELELLEDQLFTDPRPAILERLFSLKRNILQVRRIVIPQRDIVNRLARNEYHTLEATDRIFFRDVYDHLLQLDDLLDDLLILIGGARDSYLSVVNNRMNDIMKTLTVITAFFMPLAFITGFFGMNFFQPVSPIGIWMSKLSFTIVLAAMALIPLVMFVWMRKRAWI